MRLAKTILTCLLPILGLPALAAGQTSHQTTAPTLKVYSRETMVDVTVTDSKGNPVHGLKQSYNQQEFQRQLEAAGGRYLLAYSVDDVSKTL